MRFDHRITAVAAVAFIVCLQAHNTNAEDLGRLTEFVGVTSPVRTYADRDGEKFTENVERSDFKLPKPILERSDYFARVKHGTKSVWIDEAQFKVEGRHVKVVNGSGPDMGRAGVATHATRGMGED